MAEENVNVNVNFETKGFKAQLKEANEELMNARKQFGVLSDEALKAAKSVGELRDEMGDAKSQADAFSDGGKFKAVTGVLKGVAGGFSAIQGAIGLVSKDNKALEQTMLKVQSAMALTQGLTAISELGDSFKNLQTVATTALKGIKTGIAATGIGLLVIALATIVAYWDDIKAAVSGVSTEQEALNAEAAKNATASQDTLDALMASEEQLKLSGKSEKEIYDLKIKAYDTTIADAEAKQAADEATLNAQIAAAKRNQDILKGLLDFISLPLTLILETVDQVGKAFGKDFGLREGFKESVSKMIFDPKQVEEAGKETLKKSGEALNKIKEQRAGLINAQNDKEKAAATAKQKEITDQAEKDAKELAKITADAAFEATKLGKSELEKQIIDIKEKYRERLAKVKEGSQAETDLKNLKQAEIDAAEKAAAQKALDLQKEKDAKKLSETEKTLDAKYNLLQAAAVTEIKDKEALDAALLALEVKKIEEQIALQKQYGQDTTELELQLAQKKAEIGTLEEETEKARLERISENRKQQLEGVLETANSIFEAANAIQDAQKQRDIEALNDQNLSDEAKAKATDEINKKYFEKNKGVQIGQTIIQTLQSSISAFAALAGIPVVGPALGAVAAAAALATGYATVDKIRNTSYVSSVKPEASKGSKYEKGGLLEGPRHSMGGIKTAMGELEGGEFVVNREATAKNIDLLSKINKSSFSFDLLMSRNPFINERFKATGKILDQLNQREDSAPAPIKAYVVSSEMTSQQEATKRVDDIARL